MSEIPCSGDVRASKVLADRGEESDEDLPPTPLMSAILAQDHTLLISLLQSGASSNEGPRGWYGRTPLQAAALLSPLSPQILRTLLSRSADPNAPGGNNGGRTALTLAAGARNREAMEILLEAGANVNLPPARYMGRTPLQAACEGGDTFIVRVLLNRGGDVNAPPAYNLGRSALAAAAENGHGEIVESLLSLGAVVNAPISRANGITALQGAARFGDLAIVEMLLQAGVDVNAEASHTFGTTALRAAAEKGHVEVLKRLLGAGADVHVTSGARGLTALQAANINGREDVIAALMHFSAASSSNPSSSYLVDFVLLLHLHLDRVEAGGMYSDPQCELQ
nr:hypothetical protein B0A51_04919 [Rachicladosporium sp. CCFEE 5018]